MKIPHLLLTAVAAICPLLTADANPTVRVAEGQLAGRPIPSGGASFKGVPFAAPPLGDLRWHEPVPVKPWTGVREADKFGMSCVQQISGWNKQEAEGNQEDCLYLNIWTPQWPAKSPLPVMVWLYGGGNTGGGASVDYFDGVSLSSKGLILVTINYRLGLFGFFSHPGLTAESSHHASGNYGLLDQLAALRWVQANIAKFGGDPKRVTLFGQSAGAVDTSYMVATPLSKGLIQQAIQESGPPIRDTPSIAEAEKMGVHFAESQKAPAGAAEAIKFLRSLPAADLQKASVEARGDSGPAINPIIDGWVLPAPPAEIYMAGKQLNIPIIVGNNAREQPAPANVKKTIADSFGRHAAEAEAFYGVANNGAGNNDPLYGPVGIQVTADTRYRCGMIAEAIWHSSKGRTVYEYQFDVPIAGRPATQHSAEVPFVFGNLLTGGFLGGPFTDADRKVLNDIQQYWANFVKTGNPNGTGLPNWPKFDATARPFLEFTASGPAVHESLRRNICDMYIDAVQTAHAK